MTGMGRDGAEGLLKIKKKGVLPLLRMKKPLLFMA
jgi:chemotaxis response regulator CheB